MVSEDKDLEERNIEHIQSERQLISDGKTWTRRFTTSFFGDGFNFIEKGRADNMSFFVDEDGIKFGDASLNRMIIPKDVLIEAMDKFCICKTK